MTNIEKEKCISCLACISACPYEAIKMVGLFIYLDDSSKCTNCKEKYCKILCPTGAIILD